MERDADNALLDAGKAQAAELERAAARLRTVLETAPGYVMEVTPVGVIRATNRTYEGVTIDQVIGSHVLNWLPPSARPRMQAAIDAVLRGERRVELLIEGSGSDGGTAWYRSCLGPIEIDGKIDAVAILAEDITVQRRAQVEHERDRRLAALGRVSAAVAHDYNTLFTAMLCSLDAARLVADQPELLREELTTIETAVNGAAQLTQHLTRAQRPQGTSSERTDLSSGLRELAHLLERVAGKRIVLRMDVADGPLFAALSTADLNQLMLNLVINAREAMPDGGQIRVSLAVEQGAGAARPSALLRVSDTGPGIADEIVEHLFEPYFSTKERGSGFGLATCYGIAVGAGGEIRAGRAGGGGALIELVLPLHGAAQSDAEASAASTANSANATLLLVDDSPELRATLRRHFSRIGFSVLVGCDAKDALEVIGRHPGPVDLVISDVVMNGGSGIALFERLQRERPALRALAITGQAPERDLGWLRDHGVPVLRKPFSARELETRVRELLA